MSKTKVVYIVSKVSKALAFEWVVEELKDQFDFEFILLHDNYGSDLKDFLESEEIPTHHFYLGARWIYPFILIALGIKLRQLKPDVVHTHLFEASLLGLFAAKFAGIKKRVYTRHHSTYHHTYFPKAVKYDKLINSAATQIIAISNNVKTVLMEREGVSEKKISLVEHGFRLSNFKNVESLDVDVLRTVHGVKKGRPTVGIISRYVELKGVDYAIEAFLKLKQKYPEFRLVLCNAGGPYATQIRRKLSEIPDDDFIEIPFESNLFALYQLFDFYIHCPIDPNIEAFGQTYVEALAAGIPSVFTQSGIANDFIENERNALVVRYKNADDIYEALARLIENEDLRNKLIQQGQEDVERFELSNMIRKLSLIYQSLPV